MIRLQENLYTEWLKEGFLEGEYRTAYPVLSVRDCHNEIYLFDMINDNLKNW